MRSAAVLLLLLASTAPAAFADSSAQEENGQLRCTAAAIGTGGLRTRPVAANLDIVVERWSTEAERRRLVQSLKAGQDEDAILDTVRDLPRVGYLRTPPSLGWDLHFAQTAAGEDGGQRIVIATDRPINFWEAANQPRSIDYPFTFIQMQLNKSGEGKGWLSVATKVIATNDGRFVQLETYDAPPVQLNDVKCR
jgi:hypothetical protein